MNRAPLIVAVVLLLLPVLYVGSYLALVEPEGRPVQVNYRGAGGGMWQVWKTSNYRCNGEWVASLFWPLEQVDRKVRPGTWEPVAEPTRLHRITVGDYGFERIGVDFSQ